MAECKVLLTPENYRLWFEYFMGSNGALSVDIDERVASGQPFTPEVCESLYERHFGGIKGDDLMQQVNRETQKILKGVFAQLMTTSEFTSGYGDKLDAYAREINTASDLSQVQHLIVSMVRDTTRMAQSSRDLHKQLEEATVHTQELQQRLERTEKEATIDALTGLYNRLAYDRKIQELCDGFKAGGLPFCALMLDIDFFKKFNDQYGHRIGDEVLRQVASLARECLRVVDFPARYGGEEFIFLLPTTRLNNAYIIGEQIRKRVADKKLKVIRTGESLGQMTISVGVAEMRKGDTGETLIERADQSLYLAKESGRNNVKTERDLDASTGALKQG